ncbi:DUF1707 domain-containing protein [Streptomyces sp. NPDC096198]|uniref:DUF1707 SHOCT-like domain-containing protein n=1 Tax=Streptomyces sp. NPDC096198 TaxID=3366080 RepID=UPI0037FC1DD4
MTRDPQALRVGDSERDQAVDALAAHHAAGRIDFATYEDRAAAALNAGHRDELCALFADLPDPRPPYAEKAPTAKTSSAGRAAAWAAGAVWPLTLVIVLLTGVWQLVLIPVAFTAVTGVSLRSHRRTRRRRDRG